MLAVRSALLAILLPALAWAQIAGLQRGYVCDCGEVARQTEFDHCHGPHSGTCHDDVEAAHDHATDGHECSATPCTDTDRHEHAPYTEPLKSFKSQNAAFTPLVTVAVQAVPAWFFASALAGPERFAARLTPHDDRSPPECLRVARTQVILV